MEKVLACDGEVMIFKNVLEPASVAAFNDFFRNFNYSGLQQNEFAYWGQRLINMQTPLQPGYEHCLDNINPHLRILSDTVIDILDENIELARWETSAPNMIKMWPESNVNKVAYDNADELEMFIHIDNQEHMAKPIWWGVVYYPNEDFEGGEIYYPEYDYTYKPEANSLAFHSGMTRHGVKKVTSGDRYCVASLMTIANRWNENPKPTFTNNPANPWHYPTGYWGKRMPSDPIQGDIKMLRPDGTTAPYQANPVEATHDTNDHPY